MKCLMLGCGMKEPKRGIRLADSPDDVEVEWTTLDISRACNPNVVFDLNDLCHGQRLPFNGPFDEIHAYEVLEHYGTIGDHLGFFQEWAEFWRVLEPGGLFFGSTPEQHAMFADPGHKRCVSFSMLQHLTRGYYENVGKSHVTDYRALIEPHWWEMVGAEPKSNTLVFCMRKSS